MLYPNVFFACKRLWPLYNFMLQLNIAIQFCYGDTMIIKK